MKAFRDGAFPDEGQSQLTVVIVDDHPFFRSGLRLWLEERGFVVAGEAATGDEAVELVPTVAPDVVLIDLKVAGDTSGLEAIRRIARDAPAAHILALTVSADVDDVIRAVLAGASGYLLKDVSVDELSAAVRAAADGQTVIAPRVAATLVERLKADARETGPKDDNDAHLTERELQVLALMADGMGNTEIARELFIAPHTVKNHISNILGKLHVDNRLQAAVLAVRRGLI